MVISRLFLDLHHGFWSQLGCEVALFLWRGIGFAAQTCFRICYFHAFFWIQFSAKSSIELSWWDVQLQGRVEALARIMFPHRLKKQHHCARMYFLNAKKETVRWFFCNQWTETFFTNKTTTYFFEQTALLMIGTLEVCVRFGYTIMFGLPNCHLLDHAETPQLIFLGAKLASHILENEAGQISQVRDVAMWNSCLCLCLSAPVFAQTFRKRIMFDTWMRAACMVWSAHVTFCHNARKQFGFRNLCDFLCLCKRLIWITFLQGIIECSPQ